MKVNWAKMADFCERVGVTFAGAFVAIGLTTGLSDQKSLEAAAIAGAISAGKFIVVEANLYLKSTPTDA